MNDTTTVPTKQPCEHCSRPPSYVYHDGRCPLVRAIEYYPDGGIKRIEFVDERPNIVYQLPGSGVYDVLPGKVTCNQSGMIVNDYLATFQIQPMEISIQ